MVILFLRPFIAPKKKSKLIIKEIIFFPVFVPEIKTNTLNLRIFDTRRRGILDAKTIVDNTHFTFLMIDL